MPSPLLRTPAHDKTSNRLPLDHLPVGYHAGSPIVDDAGQVLVPAGSSVTENLLRGLRRRGVRQVAVHAQEWERLTTLHQALAGNKAKVAAEARPLASTAATNALDALVDQGTPTKILASADPFASSVKQHGKNPYDKAQIRRQVAQHDRTVDQIGQMMHRLNRAESVSGEQLQDLSHESLVQAAEDMDLFVSLGINDADRQTIFAHSASVSRVAVAIGVQLGLDKQQLNELGAGCLVHDAGMLQIDKNIYSANRTLSNAEFVDIARHPIIAADMLHTKMDRVPIGVRMVVYQMHERCDGSGYPRGSSAGQIHALAKIAAVADTYVALISPRPHRGALLPYDAVKVILNDVSKGLFDSRVVRALLQSLSLFPICSFVELSNGRVGRVLRGNGPAYDKPVVESWDRRDLEAVPRVIDLAEHRVTVTRALDGLRVLETEHRGSL